MDANTAALKATLEATTKSANQNNDVYTRLSSKEQSLADKIVANRTANLLEDKNSLEYKAAETQAYQAFKEETGHKNAFMFGGNEDDAYNKYMEIMYGSNWQEHYRVTNKAGTNATIQKKNEDGGWENISSEKNTLSNKTVQDTIIMHYMQFKYTKCRF